MRFAGRSFFEEIPGRIRSQAGDKSPLTRIALSCEVCAWMQWHGGCGRARGMSCRVAWRKLSRPGLIEQPRRHTLRHRASMGSGLVRSCNNAFSQFHDPAKYCSLNRLSRTLSWATKASAQEVRANSRGACLAVLKGHGGAGGSWALAWARPFTRARVPGAAVTAWRGATDQRQFAGPFDAGRGGFAPGAHTGAPGSPGGVPRIHCVARWMRNRLRKSTHGANLPS